MEILILIALVVMIVLLLAGMRKKEDTSSILLLQKETESLRQELNAALTNHMTVVNSQLSAVASNVTEQLKGVTQQLQTSTGQINLRMDNAAKVVGDVGRTLGELSKATEQVFEVGKDIAGLQQILKAPKLRGEIGEFFLGDLLSQILPTANYELQYAFKNGTRVDAVIKLNQGFVPVDSKFPLENFIRLVESSAEKEKIAARRNFLKDVKAHIEKIASLYILPDEGTFNFALMYIPAENVYYETIIKDEFLGDEKGIVTYAFQKRVIPVSPNSFYAYLQTILLGLRGLEVSKKVDAIIRHIESLQNDFSRFSKDFDTLGSHIINARAKHEEAQKKLANLGERLSSKSNMLEEEKMLTPTRTS